MRVIIIALFLVILPACTEEARNKLIRSADNVIGQDYKVSYIDEGRVVKAWTVKDGKITSGQKENGIPTGYYYFWSVETGYVQTPVDRTVVEELRN
jgi:hypothetical protein